AGIDRKALVEAVLRAEIGDDVVLADLRRLVALRSLLEIRVELGHHLAVRADEMLVVGRALENALVDAAQEQLRVVVGAAPQRLIEPAEQPSRRGMPAEPEIRRELLEPLDRIRQAR